MTRELALFNPFGIEREPGTTWIGQAPDQPDATFVKFIDFAHGVRAAVKDLQTYTERYGITTVGAAIARWSPPPDNDTLSYIDDMCVRCHCDPSSSFMPILPAFLRGIADHENGEKEAAILTDADIATGIALASAR